MALIAQESLEPDAQGRSPSILLSDNSQRDLFLDDVSDT